MIRWYYQRKRKAGLVDPIMYVAIPLFLVHARVMANARRAAAMRRHPAGRGR